MKTALITGTGKGIGHATADLFLTKGWRVIGTYTHDKGTIVSPNYSEIKLDLHSKKSVADAAKSIAKLAPQIDVLINNAGIAPDALKTKADMEKIRVTFEVNVFGLIDLTEKVLPLLATGSHVINVSSRYGSFNFKIVDSYATAYRMSKAALNMYTRMLAFRLKDKKMRVSAIHPGWVKTDMGNMGVGPQDKARPDREPKDAAADIYRLATSDVESGQFWFKGRQFEW
ncbi:MAG: SDR family NAD(P)-dependent oxidoreductase [Candidatus Andersenbacteria bacterium]